MESIDYIKLAQKYTIESHHTVPDKTSEIIIEEENNKISFKTLFKLEFPSGVTSETTELGVKEYEEVTFEFDDMFPYSAPKIYLRDDFPKVFPHINPSEEKVNPCIYEGNLNELVHQPKFFDEILDQMADWFSKAVKNNLIDSKQGWEPMRTDFCSGFLYSPVSLIQDILKESNVILKIRGAFYYQDEQIIYATNVELGSLDKEKNSFLVPIVSPLIDSEYFPNSVYTYHDLIKYFKKIGIINFYEYIPTIADVLKQVSLFFVTVVVPRPAKLIGSDSNLEVLNFAIEARYNKSLNNIPPTTKVYNLANREISTSNLLAKFSGIDIHKNTNMHLMQLGCGSLGSKIITHIARTGITNNITLIDSGYFNSHNNARHALMNVRSELNMSKSILLKNALDEFGLYNVEGIHNNILDCQEAITKDAILIDSTADFTVRNFLIDSKIQSEVIYTVLHNLGNIGLLFIESKNRNVRLDDIMSLFYYLCYNNDQLSRLIRNDEATYQTIGQGCGSLTTVVSDSKISLFAASMANTIQSHLLNGFEEEGKMYIGSLIDDLNLKWYLEKIEAPEVLFDPTFNMEIRIATHIKNRIQEESKTYSPNETGGILIGHISLVNNVISIVDLIDAPSDSIRRPDYFELGTKGLKERIKDYEYRTNGMLAYVGTWHSHPAGGTPSTKDMQTKKRLIEDRKGFPTICIICSKQSIILV